MEKRIKEWYGHFSVPEYTIAVSKKHSIDDSFIKKGRDKKFHAMKITSKGWYADPILYEYQGKTYVFMEYFDNKKKKGAISYCEVRNGEFTKAQVILEEPWHLSFPLVFEINGDIYMMPECSETEAVMIYKAVAFPNSWELVKKYSVDSLLVDSVIYKNNRDVYFISGKQNRKNLLSNKLLFAKVLINNVDFEIDFDSMQRINEEAVYSELCRNGGPIIKENGMDIRVAQEAKNGDYGVSIAFYDIKGIDEENYEEVFIQRRTVSDVNVDLPVTYLIDGIHTYSATNCYEVIDLHYRHFRLYDIVNRVLVKLMLLIHKS